MAQLALYTFGLFLEEPGHPQLRGFEERVVPIFGAAARAAGALYQIGAIADPVGLPHHAVLGDGSLAPTARTLSAWADLETAFAFVYRGVHGESMRHRREWFLRGEWPTHCLWWVPNDHVPTWEEAVARYEELCDNGPTARAFNFSHPVGPDGQRTSIAHPPRTAAVEASADGG